ncbi:MAG: hypothetical protein LBQ60_03175 [Bacteroidales bacterium]|jgi:hypothetical protein|nr:hypothetical protein [Bacteroidales bacterium]
MNRILFCISTFLFLLFPELSKACTSAIVTGKLTSDGRPLLWKHRDTSEPNNRVAYFDGGKYSFIALVNSPDNDSIVWTGTNSTGFSIMNTASYNLKDDDVEEMDKEGELMYKALSICKNLKDFEKFLDQYPRPIRVEANFGVIDAEGGSAYYEVNNTQWTKLDVNDPEVAPYGFLVVTNFSYTGRVDEGKGYIRYNNALKIFMDQYHHGNITPQWIFNELSRSFYHSLLDIDLRKDLSKLSNSGWFIDQDFIPRRSTSASVVIQGVKKREDPASTVMWTVLGYPPVGIAVPLLEKSGKNLPFYMTRSESSDNSELCDLALQAKNHVFSLSRGSGSHYFNASLLFNVDDTGYSQIMSQTEDIIITAFNARMKKWRKKRIDPDELNDFYSESYDKIKGVYHRINVTL